MTAAGPSVLAPGVTGDAVRELQRALNEAGFIGPEDGVYGTATQRAVREFQQKHGLVADGVTGTETQSALARYRPVEAPAGAAKAAEASSPKKPPAARKQRGAARPKAKADSESAVDQEEPEPGTESDDPRRARAALPGFAADGVAGSDLLGVDRSVEFLASNLAARDLQTPLAVGIFGDWGSGKSFFMRRLQERIQMLATLSAEARLRGEPTYYCPDVRHVTFNAWLYSGSEIWPSLAAQIYRSVGTSDDVGEIERRLAETENAIAERAAGLGRDAEDAAAGIPGIGELLARGVRIRKTWRLLRKRDVAILIAPILVGALLWKWNAQVAGVIALASAVLPFVLSSVRYVDESMKLEVDDSRRRELEEERARLLQYAPDPAARWKARERLGAATEVRLELEELSRRMAAGASAPGLRPTDRIVVYIDDLDRCPPDVVVGVLEAIKLVLDLPHFVVVAGVDLRWLLRAIEVRFRQMLGPEGDPGVDAWAATPQNYLEKIFQYSLVLRPIDRAGFGRLMESLLPIPKESQPMDRTNAAPVPDAAPVAATGEALVGADVAVDLTPSSLAITRPELEFMKALAPLFDTPRAAKRLANVYRLIRVAVGEERITHDASHVPVLTLLAVAISFPALAGILHRTIRTADPALVWRDFVAELNRSVEARGQGGFDVRGSVDLGTISGVEAAAWRRCAATLAQIGSDELDLRRLADFVPWLEAVASYSFHPWQELLPAGTRG